MNTVIAPWQVYPPAYTDTPQKLTVTYTAPSWQSWAHGADVFRVGDEWRHVCVGGFSTLDVMGSTQDNDLTVILSTQGNIAYAAPTKLSVARGNLAGGCTDRACLWVGGSRGYDERKQSFIPFLVCL